MGLPTRKIDRILREILHRFYEQGERFSNQKGLSQSCELSLGTINPVIARLEQFGAIERKPLGFRLVDPKRALIYWAVTRDLAKDIVYNTFVATPVHELETQMPPSSILTTYSGFRARFNTTPADYDTVFVYANPDAIKRMFRPTQRKKSNLFVLMPDDHLKRLSEGGVAPLAQIYVDLWQLGALASRFVEEFDRKLAPTALRGLEEVTKTLGGKSDNTVRLSR